MAINTHEQARPLRRVSTVEIIEVKSDSHMERRCQMVCRSRLTHTGPKPVGYGTTSALSGFLIRDEQAQQLDVVHVPASYLTNNDCSRLSTPDRAGLRFEVDGGCGFRTKLDRAGIPGTAGRNAPPAMTRRAGLMRVIPLSPMRSPVRWLCDGGCDRPRDARFPPTAGDTEPRFVAFVRATKVHAVVTFTYTDST
jgi:hypothetical protein